MIIHSIKLIPSNQANYPGTSETSDENAIVVEADSDDGGPRPPGVVSRLAHSTALRTGFELGLFGFVFLEPEGGFIFIILL
jgi:hypothetical protein